MKHEFKIGNVFETNCYGQVVITELLGTKVRIKFVTTGTELVVYKANLAAGKVRDKAQQNPLKHGWEDCNIAMVNNAGESFRVVRRASKKCVVVFDATGYSAECEYHNVAAGKVRDPYAKTVYGIGYIGEPANVPYKKQAKQLWANMMKRCYSTADQRGYYGKATVAVNWHCFANFLSDLSELPGFQGWLSAEKTGQKYNLDKDLTIEGNTVYSKYACAFIPEAENKSAGKRGKRLVDGVWVTTKP